jgi:GDPmannose 4,6-dehydratase
VSKAHAHYITVNYRESYGLFACSGILFNHESPRRGREFVSRKVAEAAARIKLGLVQEVRLGNLEARRDWGYAKDYVKAMWLMLQQPKPDDFVVATGESHSVQDLVELAFGHLGLEWRRYVRHDSSLIRPAEVDHLVGDATRARTSLGWRPTVGFSQLVAMMVDAEIQRVESIPGPAVRRRLPARGLRPVPARR